MINLYLVYALREAWRRRRLQTLFLIGLGVSLVVGLVSFGSVTNTGSNLLRNIRLLQAYLLYPLALLGGFFQGCAATAEPASEQWRTFGPTRNHGPAPPLLGVILGSTLGVGAVVCSVALLQGLSAWALSGMASAVNLVAPLILLPGVLFAVCLGALCAVLGRERWRLPGLAFMAVAFYAPLIWLELQFGLPALRPLLIELVLGALYQRGGRLALATAQLTLYSSLFLFFALFRLSGDWYAQPHTTHRPRKKT